MPALLLVALGGAVGAVCRYAVGRLFARLGGGFPLATLTVNVAGCLAIGYLLARLERAVRDGAVDAARAADLRLLLAVGLLGGLTTFSAFGHETVTMLRGGALGRAALSVALNVGLGLAAVAVGLRAGQ